MEIVFQNPRVTGLDLFVVVFRKLELFESMAFVKAFCVVVRHLYVEINGGDPRLFMRSSRLENMFEGL